MKDVTSQGKEDSGFFSSFLTKLLLTRLTGKEDELLQTAKRLVLSTDSNGTLQVLIHSGLLYLAQKEALYRLLLQETSILLIMSALITTFVKSHQLQLPFLSSNESSSCADLLSRLGMFSHQVSFLSCSTCSSTIH